MAKVLSGKVTVSSAGTAVAFPSQTRGVIALRVLNTSAGNVYVGDANVDSTTGQKLVTGTDADSRMDWPIPEGHSIKLSDVYADADTNGYTLTFIATLT